MAEEQEMCRWSYAMESKGMTFRPGWKQLKVGTRETYVSLNGSPAVLPAEPGGFCLGVSDSWQGFVGCQRNAPEHHAQGNHVRHSQARRPG
jgi:hypothetical protein